MVGPVPKTGRPKSSHHRSITTGTSNGGVGSSEKQSRVSGAASHDPVDGDTIGGGWSSSEAGSSSVEPPLGSSSLSAFQTRAARSNALLDQLHCYSTEPGNYLALDDRLLPVRASTYS